MLNPFRKAPTPAQSAESVAALRAKVETDRAAIDAARENFRQAALAEAEAAGDGVTEARKARTRAANVVADAERTLAASEAALSAALERHATVEEADAAKARAAKWRHVETLLQQRETIAAEIEAAAAALAGIHTRLLRVNSELGGLIGPGGPDGLAAGWTTKSLHLALYAAGIDLMPIPTPWGRDWAKARPFSSRIAAENDAIGVLKRRSA